jgi:hypothetical protein
MWVETCCNNHSEKQLFAVFIVLTEINKLNTLTEHNGMDTLEVFTVLFTAVLVVELRVVPSVMCSSWYSKHPQKWSTLYADRASMSFSSTSLIRSQCIVLMIWHNVIKSNSQ